ncbi:MAG: hypothetical protein JXP34_27000 [Planctomycetes bacterium]|nr:hypothetical protein [Planctomycetota bacterium]
MQIQLVLTAAESKRLIAKGIAGHPAVQKALRDGIVAVAKGTTNAYVVEELLGRPIERHRHVTGHQAPARAPLGKRIDASWPDLVLIHGEASQERSATAMIGEMGAGDVFIKGANALNYDLRQAAVLVSHPTGGTSGATIGTIIARRVKLIIPVGLEKSIPGDLSDASEILAEVDGQPAGTPALWILPGEVFTEIEALSLLAEVEALPIAAGGIGGAEGSVRLCVRGEPDLVRRAAEIVESIQGEPPFLG